MTDLISYKILEKTDSTMLVEYHHIHSPVSIIKEISLIAEVSDEELCQTCLKNRVTFDHVGLDETKTFLPQSEVVLPPVIPSIPTTPPAGFVPPAIYNEMITVDNKFAFIHIPKNAGTFVEHVLSDTGILPGPYRHGHFAAYKLSTPLLVAPLPILAGYRDPVTWYTTWFNYFLNFPGKANDKVFDVFSNNRTADINTTIINALQPSPAIKDALLATLTTKKSIFDYLDTTFVNAWTPERGGFYAMTMLAMLSRNFPDVAATSAQPVYSSISMFNVATVNADLVKYLKGKSIAFDEATVLNAPKVNPTMDKSQVPSQSTIDLINQIDTPIVNQILTNTTFIN